MAKLKLWGQPKSINVQKALWALDELGLSYERIDAGGQFGRNKDADYLTLNPNGLIPVLEDEGSALWESNAIVRYLFTKYGSAPLQPTEPILRARADAWTDWGTSTFWTPTRVLVVQLVRTAEDKRDPAQIEAAKGQIADAVRILDSELAKRPFLVGDQFTWGDISAAAAAQRYFTLPIERPATKSLEAWFAKVKERPAFKKWIDLPLT